MIGVTVPAEVRVDGRHIRYGPSTLVMTFADQAELDEIRRILRGRRQDDNLEQPVERTQR